MEMGWGGGQKWLLVKGRAFWRSVGGEDLHVSVNLRNVLSPLTKHRRSGGKLLSPRGDRHAFCPDRHPYLTHRTYRPLPGHRASNTEDLAKDAGEAVNSASFNTARTAFYCLTDPQWIWCERWRGGKGGKGGGRKLEMVTKVK